jgi:DNA-binding SARP family transcriptional activator
MSILAGTHVLPNNRYASYLTEKSNWPVMICLLGGFYLLKVGKPVELRNPTRIKALLTSLALKKDCCISHDALIQALWPNTEIVLANQSLNSLIHSLRKLLSDEIGDEPPILHTGGCYRLNTDAGIGVDIDWFESLVQTGELQERAGDWEGAVTSYLAAVDLYKGDLYDVTDTQSLVITETLRAHYLTLLSHLADYYYRTGAVSICLDYTHRLLLVDPCREDAHRLVMRCYLRLGERSQALRQYRICETILRTEFDTTPEAATIALYDQIRLAPDNV